MNIIIYSLPTCEFCHLAKAYFKERHVAYKEIDVDKDPEAQREMIAKSGQYRVPVIDIGGKIIVGFDRKELEKTIK